MSTKSDTSATEPSAPPRIEPGGGPGIPLWRKLLPEAVMLAVCVVLFTQTLDLRGTSQGPGPAMYPRILIVLLALAMIGRLAVQVRAHRGATGSEPVEDDSTAEIDASAIPLARVGQVIALSVGFVIATIYLGWVLGTFLFVPVFCWAAGKRNLLITVPFGAVLALGSAYLFVRFVYIALPTGVGPFDEFTVRLFTALGIY